MRKDFINNNIIYSSWVNFKELRDALIKIAPFCFWCNTRVVLNPAYYNGELNEKEIPANTAIIDHILTRKVKNQRQKHNSPKVLSCNKCDRSKSKIKIISKEIEDVVVECREKLNKVIDRKI